MRKIWLDGAQTSQLPWDADFLHESKKSWEVWEVWEVGKLGIPGKFNRKSWEAWEFLASQLPNFPTFWEAKWLKSQPGVEKPKQAWKTNKTAKTARSA